MIQKYKVVAAHSISELERKVDHEWRCGWILQGGVATNITEGRVTLYQAMTKLE